MQHLHIDYSLKYVTAVQSNVIVYQLHDSSEKFSDPVPWMLFARLHISEHCFYFNTSFYRALFPDFTLLE